MTRLGFALSLATLCGPLMGQEVPVPSTSRVMFTDCAEVVEPGAFQIDFGVAARSFRDGGKATVSPTLLYLGVLPGLDLRLYTDGYARLEGPRGEARHGFTDAWLGFQWRFLDLSGLGIQASVNGWHKEAHADRARGFSTGRADDDWGVVLQQVRGPWMWAARVGGIWSGVPEDQGGGTARQGYVAGSLTRRLSPRANLCAELYALEGTRLGGHATATQWSFVWEGDRATFDVGVDVGLSQAAPKWVLTAGVSKRF